MRICKLDLEKDQDGTKLVREWNKNYASVEQLSNAKEVSRMLNEVMRMDRRCQECLVLVCMNTKMKVKGLFELSKGTINASIVSTRDICQRALMCDAYGIIVAHNHPSGSSDPSNEDIMVTRKIKQAADIMDIKMLDHIIIGEDEFFSFKDRGYLD